MSDSICGLIQDTTHNISAFQSSLLQNFVFILISLETPFSHELWAKNNNAVYSAFLII